MAATLGGAAIGAATNFVLKASDRRNGKHDPLRQLRANRINLEKQVRLLDVELRQNDFTMKDTKWEALKDTARKLKEDGEGLQKQHDDCKPTHWLALDSTTMADLSKNMKDMADSIDSHIGQMTAYKKELIIAQRRSSGEIDKLPWVKKSVDHIWTLLDKNNIKKVGVLAAEVNETTIIMNSLHDKAVREFERVMFVDSKSMGTEYEMGEAILHQLKSSVPSNRNQIKSEVSDKLQNKKYLLLLNQVPRKIDLEMLGILNIHEEGKVVAATKDERVYCEMGEHDYEWVKSAGESWKILREIVGEIADHQGIKPLAQKIAKECGKEKWLIRAIGMYLKDMENKKREEENQRSEEEIKEDIRSIWRECKDELQSHHEDHVEDCDDGLHVFHFLCKKLTNLGKNCLLYGALFPQDERIYADFLIECWGVERFIPQDEGTNAPIFKRTRVAGYNELQCLKNVGLLETSAEFKHVTMPPLFRRWALRMDNGLQMLIRFTEEDKAGYPKPENRRSKTRISLRCEEDLKALLKGVNRKGILALFLHRNPNVIEKILSSVFVKGSQLQILDLGGTGIESLPDSISNLRALKALYLNDCGNLRKLPSKITKLKETLEILDVSGTGILYLPAEIRDFGGLKCLRVSFNTPRPTSSGLLSRWKKKSGVPTWDLISSLSSLEELAISADKKSRDSWGKDKESRDSWGKDIRDIIQHMANLEELTALHLHFPSVDYLADFIEKNKSWKKMGNSSGQNVFRSFKFTVGSFGGVQDKKKNEDIDVAEHKAERHFQVFAPSETPPSELPLHFSSAIQDVLQQSTTFELIRDQSIDHLSRFGIARIANLKACAIRSCSKMESIISNGHSTADAALPHLEVLELFNLCSLASIYGAGLLGHSSFANLTTLIVVSCDALRVILPFELAQNVTNLKHLRVKDCFSVAAIIAVDEAVSNTASSQVPVATDAADENPTGTNFLPSGERLHNGAGGQVALHAADQNRSILLGKLETLILDGLANLQKISHGVSLSWSSLKELKIVQCDKLQYLPLGVDNVGKLKLITCHRDWWTDVSVVAAGVSDPEVIKAQFSCNFVERPFELLS